jgi:hypothetical protein
MFARILASLAAGWLTVVAEIGLFLRIFPKNYMDFMAGLAILIGLIVSVVVWRATERWLPRRATESELAQGFEVHLGPNLLAVMILFGIVSFGIFALLFWLFARRMPRRLDPQGMTLRNGGRIAWKEVVSVDEVWVTR